jgi:hypothetical protein
VIFNNFFLCQSCRTYFRFPRWGSLNSIAVRIRVKGALRSEKETNYSYRGKISNNPGIHHLKGPCHEMFDHLFHWFMPWNIIEFFFDIRCENIICENNESAPLQPMQWIINAEQGQRSLETTRYELNNKHECNIQYIICAFECLCAFRCMCTSGYRTEMYGALSIHRALHVF